MRVLLFQESSGRLCVGYTLHELAVQAGAVLVGRSLRINGVKYCHYSDEFNEPELRREFGRDAVRLLRRDHGWALYKEAL